MKTNNFMENSPMEALLKENKNLKNDLEQERKRSSRYYAMFMGMASPDNKNSNSTITTLKEELKLRDAKITELKEQLGNSLRNSEQYERKAVSLEIQVQELDMKLNACTQGHNWKNAMNANVRKSHEIAARVLCHIIKGSSVNDTVAKMYGEDGIEIVQMTVYRAISVKDNTDRERINAILFEYPEVFEANGLSKQDVLDWFNIMRIKKLHLISEQDLIARYGDDAVKVLKTKGIVLDRDTNGVYYRPQDFDALLNEDSWGE